MASEKAPAFQFYPKEFLIDGNVAGMSLVERGAYITLLCLCWQEGSLPAAPSRLANMVGLSARAWARIAGPIVACFNETDGRLVHPRLERERDKQETFRQRQRDAAAQRWLSQANAKPMPEACSPISDLQTNVKSTPLPPARGGRITRKERQQAEKIRDRRFGSCKHDPPCLSIEEDIERIVDELRQKVSA